MYTRRSRMLVEDGITMGGGGGGGCSRLCTPEDTSSTHTLRHAHHRSDDSEQLCSNLCCDHAVQQLARLDRH